MSISDTGSRQRRFRKAAIEILGGKCVRCGFNGIRALQIDHVNGGGKKHVSSKGPIPYYKEVIESTIQKEGKFQLLCANCNWIKKVVNKEC